MHGWCPRKIVAVPVMASAVLALGACGSAPEAVRGPGPRAEQGGEAWWEEAEKVALNRKADGFHGIWYMNTPLDSEYRFKYSGGLGTYTAKHNPFAVYRPEVERTYFVYGGTEPGSHQRHDLATRAEAQAPTSGVLLHMVSYYDHRTGMVARPTILLDKFTRDAHDNPVLSVDDDGYIWVFSTAHGTSRPAYIHRSTRPHDIDEFELVRATTEVNGTTQPITNFSYMQSWYLPGHGFVMFFTRYGAPADRTPYYMTSPDGVRWSAWKPLAAIELGHYQISTASHDRAGTAMNMHPDMSATETLHGLNWRTNLYYLETRDFGKSWQAADGTTLDLPLTTIENPALVHDYRSEGLLVYLKDIAFDAQGNPVILYITSRGYAAGPENAPRTWTTARWTGTEWEITPITTSDNNYDMGSLYLESPETWRIIAPTEPGPQRYNPGGEVAMWIGRKSHRGRTWTRVAQLTSNSPRNHTYVRRPVDAHPDFYAFWADGNGREPSESRLYFATRDGEVYRLPTRIDGDFGRPERVGK